MYKVRYILNTKDKFRNYKLIGLNVKYFVYIYTSIYTVKDFIKWNNIIW